MNDEFLGFLRRIGLGTFLRPNWEQRVNPVYAEVAFWVLVVLLFLLLRASPRTRGWFAAFENRLRLIGRHKRACVVGAFIAPILLRAIFLLWVPVPVPAIHDEFSYLLGADTLVHGRLANPMHPMWVHFESFHINMHPTYESMYQPGQALFLAFGQKFFGSPYVGVLLGLGLMCASLVWALQAWVPPQWPVLIGIFCVFRFSTFSYFGNSYWGGCVAAFAGTLLFGILGRAKQKLTPGYAALYAVGLLLLANTRTYEGFVFCIIPTLAMLWCIRRHSVPELIKATAPALVILVAGFAFMAYYNWRGTGSPAQMPYMVNHATYHISKPFLWQTRGPIPNYNHPHMRHFFVFWELPAYLMSREPWGLWIVTQVKLGAYYIFYFWPIGALLLVSWWLMLFRSRRMRLFAATLLLVFAGLLLESWAPVAHYAAPAMVCWLALVIFALRWMRQWSFRGDRFGSQLALAVLLVLAGWTIVRTTVFVFDPYETYGLFVQHTQEFERERIKHLLERTPGQHVVIVHQTRTYYGGVDWIYNSPDIDSSKVIWARDMGPQKNRELMQYYAGRNIWYVDQSDGTFQLHPYRGDSVFMDYAMQAVNTVPLPSYVPNYNQDREMQAHNVALHFASNGG